MIRTHDIETALRSLDAADLHTSARQTADLERIVATGTSTALPRRSPSARTDLQDRTARHRCATRKAGFAVAALVAATAGVIALPPLSGGDRAFASWTPHPEAVPPTAREEAVANCRDAHDDDAAAQLRAAQPVIAERRGVWTTVVLAGPKGFTASCITDESSPFYSESMIGQLGMPADWAPPGPRQLTATSLGYGVVDGGELSMAAGFAGSDVTSIVYSSPAYGDVTATLAHGHFALWLPGAELEEASREGMRLEVTYRDGRTANYLLTL